MHSLEMDRVCALVFVRPRQPSPGLSVETHDPPKRFVTNAASGSGLIACPNTIRTNCYEGKWK